MYRPIEDNGIFPTQNGNYTLLFDPDKKLDPFAVVLNYNPKAEYGSQWDAGHYYSNIYDAIAGLRELGGE